MTKKINEYKTKPILNPIEAATDKEWLEKWSENIKPLAKKIHELANKARERENER